MTLFRLCQLAEQFGIEIDYFTMRDTKSLALPQGWIAFDLNSEVKNTPHIVKVDGVQLFSADWVFEQMQAQSCRIDRSNKFALLGIAVGVVAVILAILL